MLFLSGCTGEAKSSRPRLGAGIPPVAGIVKAVAGSDFEVTTLLPQGKNPHDYSPGPHIIGSISRTALFFSAGMPFELRAETIFADKSKIVDIRKNTRKRMLENHNQFSHSHHHDADDPHIWLDLDNAVQIARNISQALCRQFPDKSGTFQNNLKIFESRAAALKSEAKAMRAKLTSGKLFVYHPAFGYFTDMVGIQQIAVETGGREPSAARLAEIIRDIKNSNAKVIIVQKEFSPGAAAALERNTGAKAIAADPMGENIFATLQEIISTLVKYD